MKFPQNFFAGAGVLTAGAGGLTAGAGGEMTGVCTALLQGAFLYCSEHDRLCCGWLVSFVFQYFRNEVCYQKFKNGYYNYFKGSYR